jgi:predicted small lipoprotein YifL
MSMSLKAQPAWSYLALLSLAACGGSGPATLDDASAMPSTDAGHGGRRDAQARIDAGTGKGTGTGASSRPEAGLDTGHTSTTGPDAEADAETGSGSGASDSGTGSGAGADSGTGSGSGTSGSGSGSGTSDSGSGSGTSDSGTGSGTSDSGASGTGTGSGSGANCSTFYYYPETSDPLPCTQDTFCESAPIDSTSAANAADACESCERGGCFEQNVDALGGVRAASKGDGYYYVFEDGVNAITCGAGVFYSPGAGMIVGPDLCPIGYWAE